MVVQANETITGLTYVGEQALVTQDVTNLFNFIRWFAVVRQSKFTGTRCRKYED